MKALIREPLLHFLLLGAGLFILYGAFNRDRSDNDPQTIVVNRERLLTFIQYRSRAFDGARSIEILNNLSRVELQNVVGEYVREEALYREAKALQLDKNDYVSRLRLIQQLEFTTRGFTDTTSIQLTDEEIEQFYDAHRATFYIPSRLTFTHVFFSLERHAPEQAKALARAELLKLNQRHVRFDQAPAFGERFLYQTNYVGRDSEEILSHFGTVMQGQLFALTPDEHVWRGPYESPYGYHLVLLTGHRDGYLQPLIAVRSVVEQQARQAALDARFEQSILSIVRAYSVKVEPIQETKHHDPKARA